MLGIPGYKPLFLDDPAEFIRLHKDFLSSLIGQSISRYWLMWDLKNDDWNTDGPVILEIGGTQVELCVFQTDQLSLTRDSIDLVAPLDWYGAAEEFPLRWQNSPFPELYSALHCPIHHIHLLTHKPLPFSSSPSPIYGLEFTLEDANGSLSYFSLHNGLDENALSFGKTQVYHAERRLHIAG